MVESGATEASLINGETFTGQRRMLRQQLLLPVLYCDPSPGRLTMVDTHHHMTMTF